MLLLKVLWKKILQSTFKVQVLKYVQTCWVYIFFYIFLLFSTNASFYISSLKAKLVESIVIFFHTITTYSLQLKNVYYVHDWKWCINRHQCECIILVQIWRANRQFPDNHITNKSINFIWNNFLAIIFNYNQITSVWLKFYFPIMQLRKVNTFYKDIFTHIHQIAICKWS